MTFQEGGVEAREEPAAQEICRQMDVERGFSTIPTLGVLLASKRTFVDASIYAPRGRGGRDPKQRRGGEGES